MNQKQLDKAMKALMCADKPDKEAPIPPMTKKNLDRKFRMRMRDGKPVMEEVD